MLTNLEKVKMEIEGYEASDDLINYYLDKYTEMACNITHYTVLPTELDNYVISTVVEAINRRTHEGEKSNSSLGVSTTFSYKDIEESLKAKLIGKKNPLSLVGLRTSE